jgi:hypothetical protein
VTVSGADRASRSELSTPAMARVAPILRSTAWPGIRRTRTAAGSASGSRNGLERVRVQSAPRPNVTLSTLAGSWGLSPGAPARSRSW